MPRQKKRIKDLSRNEFIARYVWKRARAVLRFWPPAKEALTACQVAPGLYVCNACHKVKKGKFVQRDHLVPIGSLKGITWDEAFFKLFCEKENFQILCIECHKKKTKGSRA